jgi:hypothetical protein
MAGLLTNLSQPLGEGFTFLAQIPGDSKLNSAPILTDLPEPMLCAQLPFVLDLSADDPDGDSLVYRLVDCYAGTNLQGLGTGNPNFGGNQPIVDPHPPLSNPMGPPPYNTVNYAFGHSGIDPFGNGLIALDAQSGLLTDTMGHSGTYLYAVEVAEYRDGVLLGTSRRSFSVHVDDCWPQGNNLTSDLTVSTAAWPPGLSLIRVQGEGQREDRKWVKGGG